MADSTVEADETIVLSIASGSGYSIGSPSSATATIVNDDVPTASISVSPGSVAEDGADNLIYTVTLDQPSLTQIVVPFVTGGSATSGADYAALTSPLVIAAGQTSGMITINPTVDSAIEPDETVVISLAAGNGYTVGSPGSATGTILNDDQPELTIDDVSVTEGNSGLSSANFTISLSQPAGIGGVSFEIATSNGTALAFEDYYVVWAAQTIAAGSSSTTFSVPVVGDTLNEADETFVVNISNVAGAFFGGRQGLGIIANDDAVPALSINNVSVTEGNSGTKTANFTVSLNAASGQTVSVDYVTTNGQATAGSDYNYQSGRLTFAPGTTVQGIAVTINGDTVVESDETFGVLLLGEMNASPARTIGIATILNDDILVTIAPATMRPAIAGSSYSQTFTASGGKAPYGFSITAGALPAGLSLSVAGVLSGTPTASGSFSFTATATDSGTPSTGSQAYTLTVAAPTITLAATTLTQGNWGQAYSARINAAAGGIAPYTYAFSAGALPPGINLDSATGRLSGTPTADGAFAFTLTATDSTTGTAGQASQSYIFTVASPTIALAPSSLPAPTAGIAYSQNLSATGGTTPHAFSVSAGAPPAGLSLSGAGVLFGTPTATGTFNFTVTATDSSSAGTRAPYTGSRSYTISVSSPAISLSSSLANGTIGGAYAPVISANGGTGTYSFAVTAGAVPTGVLLGSDGQFSGVPTAGGTFNFTVTATDTTSGAGAPYSGSRAYSVIIAAPTLALSPTMLGTATAGVAYGASISATGGTSAYSYAISAGALPAGISLATNGTLSGTPTAAGSFAFTVTATDSSTGTGPYTGSAAYTLSVTAATITIGPSALANATAGVAYSETISASGATAGYSYAVTSGGLPAGLTLASDGSLAGTPTEGGSFNLTITATDSSTGTGAPFTGSRSYSLSVAAATVLVMPATLPDGTAGISYSQNLTASGGTGQYSFAVTGGALPAGWTLSSAGVLSGSASAAGSFNFTVAATDGSTGSGAPYSGSRAFTVGVQSPSVSLTAPTLTASVGQPYSGSFAAAGGIAPYSYSIASGSLPAGLSLDADGVLSGTPTSGGPFNFTVLARDSTTGAGAPYGVTIAYSFTVIAPTLSLSPATLSNGSVGLPYTQAISASGGTAPFTYAVSGGTLPAGLALDAASGTISGTPTQGGMFNITITATDSSTGAGGAYSTSQAYALTVAAPGIALAPSTLPDARYGTNYSQTLVADGGTAPYIFTISTGALPDGLVLDAGVISGSPTAAGKFDFTVNATDSSTGVGAPYSTSLAYTVAVGATDVDFVFSPNGGALADAMAGETYSQSLSASGGTDPLLYRISAGDLPKGMVLNISTGELTASPVSADAVGAYDFTIEVRDAKGSTGTARFSLLVGEREVGVQDKVVTVAPGSTPANVNLSDGATGGPFIAGEVLFVEPAGAGRATIIMGELAQAGGEPPMGWYLKFEPNPAFSGEARVGYRLKSLLGYSDVGVVTYRVAANAETVASDIEEMVSDFVQTRQNLIASSIQVPNLLQRRRLAAAMDPVSSSFSPSEDGLLLGFATSTAQMSGAGNAINGVMDAPPPSFNLWVDGTIMVQNRENDGDRWGSFGVLSAGADYLLNDKALIGLSMHYDRMSDPTDADAMINGSGWLLGPYASFELGTGVFWDSSLLYGGSSNDIDTPFWDGDFDTRRWLVDTSISGVWDLDAVTKLTPKLRAVYLFEKVLDYAVENASEDAIDIEGFTAEQLRVSIGAEIARAFALASGLVLTPTLGVTAGFSGLDGSGAFGSVSAGLTLQSQESWSVNSGLLLNMDGEGESSLGGKIGVSGQF